MCFVYGFFRKMTTMKISHFTEFLRERNSKTMYGMTSVSQFSFYDIDKKIHLICTKKKILYKNYVTQHNTATRCNHRTFGYLHCERKLKWLGFTSAQKNLENIDSFEDLMRNSAFCRTEVKP